MTDYLRAADDLRSLCQSADQVLTDSVREAAIAYRDACQEVNARLRRCEEFLQKGLRSEAIHMAEAEPPLLDALAALDFPEREQWDQLAAMYGLPAAPKLRVETAEALNRAYSEEQPLQHLLRAHRRLNLAHAPLSERLVCLRELHKCDGGNPVWTDDVRNFEAARFRELTDETERAFAEEDYTVMSQCWDEIRTAPWLTPVPQQLVNRMRHVFLKRLAPELEQARQAGDFVRGQKLREQWDSLTPTLVLSPSDGLCRQAEPALRWIETEQSRQERKMTFEVATSDLEEALRAGKPVAQLREHWAVIQSYGMVLPAGIRDRYYKRVEEQRRERDQREKLILAGVFSVGALALVVFLIFVLLRAH